MTRTILLSLALACIPLQAPAQVPPREARREAEAPQQRRARLEQQVRERFIAQAAEQMGLDAAQRARLEGVLSEGAAARRELARDSRRLRMELVEAVRDEATSPAAYRSLLDRLDALRARELRLERQETAALADFLDPRQQAAFLVLRMRLNERVRGMRGEGPGGPPEEPRRRLRRPGG